MSRVEPNRNVYVGHRYVPLLVGEWDKSIQYEGLSIVTFKGNSYTSKKMTPPGIDIENNEYWVLTGNYNAQIEYYRQETERVAEDLEQTKKDVNKRIDDTVEHVDSNISDLTIYVNDEVRKNKSYVDDSVSELTKNVNDSLSDNRDFVNESMDETLSEMRTLTLNIESFGAISLDDDSSFDSSGAIIDTLNYAEQNGISDILIPNKKYGVSNPIPMKSGIKLKTQSGSLNVLPNSNWVERHSGRGVIELVSVEKVSIENLKIEGNISDSHNATTGILLLDTHSNYFEGVNIKNLGAVNSIPSGGLIRGVARDTTSEFSGSIPEIYNSVTGAVKDNTFYKCTVELTNQIQSSFSIRMLTDWETLKSRESVKNKMENNNFIQCNSIGVFHWNHLEFAGTGTVNNSVRDCYFTGHSITAIDFDKGASFNTADNNYIEKVGLPNALLDQSNLNLAVINVHGFSSTLTSDGNIVINNKIFNSDNPSTRNHSINACAIGILEAHNNKIENNIIEGLNNNTLGCGINIGHQSINNYIKGNTFKSTHTGVLCNFNSSSHSENKIIDNLFNDMVRGIIYGGISDSELKGIEISGNTVKLNNSGSNYPIQITSVAHTPKIKGNTVYNGFEGINVQSPFAIIDGNIVVDSDSRSFRITSKGRPTLINNLSVNPGLDDLIVSNDKPTMSGNIFTRTPNHGGVTSYNNGAPTDGDWIRGDKVYATIPRPGNYIGWACTESGNPGTWKGFGLIEE